MSEGKTEEAVEVMARAIAGRFLHPSEIDAEWTHWSGEARAALAALEKAGWVLVPPPVRLGTSGPMLKPGTRVEYTGLLGAAPGEVRHAVITEVYGLAHKQEPYTPEPPARKDGT